MSAGDRCNWCGRFVTKDTKPIEGVNRWQEPLAQTLCPDDAPLWRSLSDRNKARGETR